VIAIDFYLVTIGARRRLRRWTILLDHWREKRNSGLDLESFLSVPNRRRRRARGTRDQFLRT
jgi:hypothetical protein